MTFEDYVEKKSEPQVQERLKEPVIIKEDSGPGIGVIILAVLGGLALLGLLVGSGQSK